MSEIDPSMFYGAEVARQYDDALRGDEADATRFLAGLSAGRPALELAIGTGRIALPLAAEGVEVHGIELSPHMVEQLRNKPGGGTVPVAVGDMTRVRLPGEFGLVYLVYNTIFNLRTQEDQVACFENAARHLVPGGAFVVETAVPSAWTDRHVYARPEWIGADAVGLDVVRYDAATQIFEENHVHIATDGIRFNPVVHRLAWPSELDLMARIAGLTLTDRFAGWRREPFTSASAMHVSIYRRPAG